MPPSHIAADRQRASGRMSTRGARRAARPGRVYGSLCDFLADGLAPQNVEAKRPMTGCAGWCISSMTGSGVVYGNSSLLIGTAPSRAAHTHACRYFIRAALFRARRAIPLPRDQTLSGTLGVSRPSSVPR